MENSQPSSHSQMLTCVILSIKPKYASAIISGEKKFEFRKVRFTRKIDVVVMYVTTPVMRVVAEFDVDHIISNSPDELWNKTNKHAGIDKDSFFEYFNGKNIGYAIKIGDIRKYQNPFIIKEKFGINPPQSFAYIKN